MNPRIALALSGGGFRAAIFHLGVLRRLAELGWLSHVDIVSTVSGGSILGAFMTLRWDKMKEDGYDWGSFDKSIAKPFLDLVISQNFIRDWLVRFPKLLLRKPFNRSYTRTKLAAELLGSRFYSNRLCSDLPEHPYLILNATSLQAIRAWRFTRKGMGDSRIGHATWSSRSVPLGEAVGASAAFPPVFPPMRVSRAGFQFTGPIHGEPPMPQHPIIPLTDGGVYDNMSVEVVWKESILPGEAERMNLARFLVVSDAGYPAQYRFRASGIPVLAEALLLYRADSIAREQVSALRRRDLVSDFANPRSLRKGLLVMLGSNLGKIPDGQDQVYSTKIGQQFRIPDHLVLMIQRVRTHLTDSQQSSVRH